MKSVSVVIPTYNRKETLPRAVESVFAQDYPIHQVVIVDDGSKDGTADLLLLQDPRILYLVNEENLGAQGTRNRGLEAATGEAVAFLDSDDYWTPQKIGKQIDIVEKNGDPDRYAVTCGYTQFGQTGGFNLHPAEVIRLEDIMVHNLIGPTSILLASRNLLNEVGRFDLAMPACQDYELYVRLLEQVPFFGVPEVLVYQDTESSERITKHREKVVAAHRELYSRIRATATYRAQPWWRRATIKLRQDRALSRR